MQRICTDKKVIKECAGRNTQSWAHHIHVTQDKAVKTNGTNGMFGEMGPVQFSWIKLGGFYFSKTRGMCMYLVQILKEVEVIYPWNNVNSHKHGLHFRTYKIN